MLFCLSPEKEFHWHVGKGTREIHNNSLHITCLTADGDELHYILGKFSNPPRTENPTTLSWYGDWAKFIAGNL